MRACINVRACWSGAGRPPGLLVLLGIFKHGLHFRLALAEVGEVTSLDGGPAIRLDARTQGLESSWRRLPAARVIEKPPGLSRPRVCDRHIGRSAASHGIGTPAEDLP